MNTRRKFLGLSLGAGFFGLFGKSAQSDEIPLYTKSYDKKRGVFVYTVNVGMLPPIKAEAFIERLKDRFKKEREKDASQLDKDFDHIFLATRQGETRIEVHLYDRDGKAPKTVYGPVWEWKDATEIEKRQWKKEAIEFTLLMLGAPVTSVELDKEALEKLYDHSWNTVENYGRSKASNSILCDPYTRAEYAKDGLHAHAKLSLGRIRSKYPKIPGYPQYIEGLDGKSLVEEAREDLLNWKECLRSA